MILRQFPGSSNVRARGERRSDYASFGLRNTIVYAQARNISYAEHTAPLSIKTTLKGREIYEVGNRAVAVDEDSYLVLNDDQPYSSYIDFETPVESFCIFFRSNMAGEVLNYRVRPHAGLLDDPVAKNGQPIHFFQKLHRHDPLVSPVMRRLHTGISEGMSSPLWLDEQFHALMEALISAHALNCLEADRTGAIRPSTRMELYRRLSRARDYIDSCYSEPLNLGAVARIACLSEYHFLRLFRQVYKTTPHQYLTSKRLRVARSLLEKSDRSVTEVCLSVGFENPGSFARLFKRCFGLSPRELRRLP